jgi:aryl-alcohol dehydrogenase-like predicted oxidoreductase
MLVSIPGTKRRTYLAENVGAADIRLSDADMARLDRALRPDAIAGPRYNARNMATIDR